MWSDLFGSGGPSELAREVDLLSLFLLGMSALFILSVFVVVVVFSIRYRARPGHQATSTRSSRGLVLVWTCGPLVAVLAIFFWSARIQAGHAGPPPESIEVAVSGRQWMWTFRHDNGRTEINALHVPVGVPIVLHLESEDVLHRLSLPAFRLQQDAVPDMPTQVWFHPTEEGSYHFFCTEFCGTGHSTMSGTVYVLDPIKYEHWVTGDSASMTPEEAGGMLFEAFRCDSCHIPAGGGTGPPLVGLFGQDATFADGSSVAFDAAYVRESLLEPKAKISKGYEPVMPSYKGQLDESQIGQLSAYLQSLADE
jgi:cytochrome c oxidase subunit II